jgi:hypothetical protein
MSNPTTHLLDLNGEPHRYECRLFAFDEAFDLGLELAGVVGGPIGDAFKGMLLGSGMDDLELDGQVLGSIAGTLGDLPGKLATAGGSRLIARILAQTSRVGDDGNGGKVRQLLDLEDDRNAAYGGANLREAIDAVRWVLTVNYGPFLMGLWDALQPQLGALESLRRMRHSPPEESETQSSEHTSPTLKPTEVVS